MFFKTTATQNNDLGWRGFLPGQFMLLLWATDLPAVSRQAKRILGVLLWLGAAGVVYDLAVLRLFPVLADAGLMPKIAWMSRDARLGERTYANREAYEWLRAHTSSRAVIQQNPQPVFQDTFYGLYGHRQTVAADPACGSGYGGDPGRCDEIFGRLAPLFGGGPESLAPAFFETACAAFPLDVFVARDTDAAWSDRETWVWTRPAIFRNKYVALIPCPGAGRLNLAPPQ